MIGTPRSRLDFWPFDASKASAWVRAQSDVDGLYSPVSGMLPAYDHARGRDPSCRAPNAETRVEAPEATKEGRMPRPKPWHPPLDELGDREGPSSGTGKVRDPR
ncbi:hypothetical protein GCM10010460_25030 [Microbacterium terrae]|nr:hypothetical protein GCM10017594_08090 [Microbacterium terrae]